MSNADDFSRNIIGELWKTNNEINKQKQENRGPGSGVDTGTERKMFLLILAVIGLVGPEGAKALLRKNFGSNGISMFRLVICSLAFLVLSALFLAMALTDGVEKLAIKHIEDSQASYIITSVLYFLLAIVTFIKGIRAIAIANTRNDIPKDYNGDSQLLGFMLKDGVSMKTIQTVAEPLFLIATGIGYSLYVNILGGIPLAMLGFSLWIYAITESLFLGNRMQQTVARKNEELNPDDGFFKVQ